VDNVRTSLLAVLDKVRYLLTAEPARMIGYGAAIAIFLIVQLLNALGFTRFPLITLEQSIAMAGAAIVFLVPIVEGIRRFVYSPQTYIEDLADEYQNGHDLAHLEQAMALIQERIRQAQEAEQVAFVPVAPAPEDNPNRQN